MGRPTECPACGSASRRDLDIRLAAGESLALLAAQFDISEYVLAKHKRDHLRHLPVQLRDDPGSILHDLQRAEKAAWTVYKLAEEAEKPDPKLMLLALAEIRFNKRAQVQTACDLKMMIGGLNRDAWERIKAALAAALERHPEIKDEIMQAIELAE